MTSHEALWAREGDMARDCWEVGCWSAFASNSGGRWWHGQARRTLHGFDFWVESVNGTKTMVKEEAP